ncbi:hypothetical protein PENSPDRAFT_753691 [Peniophora sp. CONT]|nr:hypothetical protein PENSPDRAFT_753691 [Peniophora sp. CONT]
MSGPDAATVLDEQGWVRQADGPYFEAWRLFWGNDYELCDVPPHKAWTKALERTSQFGSSDWRLQTMAQLLLNPEGEDVTLRSCAYIDTPWTEELPHTRGKIVVREDYERIAHQLMVNPDNRHRDGMIVQGQAGVGKTYLAHYLLIRQLSEQKLVIFSPHEDVFLLFHESGVYVADDLERDDNGYPALRAIAPTKTWIIWDTPPDQEEPAHSATDPFFFLVQVCQPLIRYYHYWHNRFAVDYLAVDAPSAPSLLAESLVQKDIRPRKDDLARVLEHLHAFGARPALCFRRLVGMKSKIISLEDYLDHLDAETVDLISRLASADWQFPGCIRLLSDEPDILILRCNLGASPEALVAVLPSRYIANKLRQHLSFESLRSLTNMGIIQSPADGLSGSRYWLFEQLCHAILSTGDPDLLNHHILRLAPCHPLDSAAKAGSLRQSHFSHSRTIQSFEANPPPFDPAIYCVPHLLPDAAFHAIMYSLPFASRRDPAQQDNAHRPVTRQAAKRAAAASALSGAAGRPTTPARMTRSTKRARQSSEADDARSPSPLKKPKLKSEKRAVVFLQMMLHAAPDLPESGLERIRHIMDIDPFAEYSMVFVTLKDEEVDLSAIPAPWTDKLKWYQLEIDLPFA